MRSATSITLHAILAACLVAFAASSAAAGPTGGKEEVYFTITITEGRVGATQSYVGRKDGRVQQIQASGWQWSSVSKVDSFTLKQGMKSSVTGETVQGAQDIVITGSRIPTANTAPERGTLRVKVKMPWLACEEGRKFPSLELSGGGQRLVLKDAVIASCGKVGVRGWDPKDKKDVTGQAEPR